DGQLWRLGYTGTLTAAGAANVDTSDYWLITATNPTAPSWRVSAADNATPAATAMSHDGTGAEVYATGDWRFWTGQRTIDNQGGALSVTTWVPDVGPGRDRAAYI